VYTYVGSENIYQPIAPFSIESPLQSAGPRALWEDNHQSAVIVQDRIHLPGRIQLLAGGRFDSLRDNNYSLSATSPGTPPIITDKHIWLPQYAITFNPVSSLTLYGNYGVLLSLGPQGPWWGGQRKSVSSALYDAPGGGGCEVPAGPAYPADHRAVFTCARRSSSQGGFKRPTLLHGRIEFYGPGDLCLESRAARRTTASK